MSAKRKKFVEPNMRIIRLERDAEIQLKYYSDTSFSDEQVTEIFKGFMQGLSKEDVDKFAYYDKSPEEMKSIRLSIAKEKGFLDDENFK